MRLMKVHLARTAIAGLLFTIVCGLFAWMLLHERTIGLWHSMESISHQQQHQYQHQQQELLPSYLLDRTLSADEIEYALHYMDNNFRIFKYALPKELFGLKTKQCGINTGHIRGYGLEKYFIHALHSRSKWITNDVNRADMFFVPITPCAARWEHKDILLSKEENYERGKLFTKEYVSRAVNWVSELSYFSKRRFRDHFWISSHDRGIQYADDALSDFRRFAIALVNTATDDADEYGPLYKPCRDISTPCSVNFDLTAYGNGGIDVALESRWRVAFFAGNMESNVLRKTVRKVLMAADQNGNEFTMYSGRMDDSEYREAMLSSVFCLHLKGHQVWSPRLMEYLWYGCVPVLIADGYHLPLGTLVDWDEFSIRVCEADIASLPSMLRNLIQNDPDKVRSLQRAVQRIYKYFVFNPTPEFGDAFHLTLLQLYRRYRAVKAATSAVFVDNVGHNEDSILNELRIQGAKASGAYQCSLDADMCVKKK